MAIEFIDEEIRNNNQATDKIEFIDDPVPVKQQRSPDVIDKLLPTGLASLGRGPAKFEEGQLNLLGNVFNRPGAAIRSSIQAIGKRQNPLEAYIIGSMNPNNVKSFQEQFIANAQDSTSVSKNIMKGFVPSAAGLVADTLTNPGDILSGFIGGKVANTIANTPIGQTIKEIMTRDREITDVTKPILDRFPRLMNDKWIEEQAYNAKAVLDGIDDALHNAYDDIYKKVGNFSVDAKKIDDIILNSNLDDSVIKDIDRIVGSGQIDTVEKAKSVMSVLKSRTPDSFYLSGGQTGKGGLANPKIRQVDTISAIRDVLREGVKSKDPVLSAHLRKLDYFASERVYPTMRKMRGIIGKERIPNTEGLATTYSLGSFGKASQRQTIRSTPSIAKELKSYISKNYVKDLTELTRNSRQLVSDMGKFRTRQAIKYGGGAVIGLVGAYNAVKNLGGGK